MRLIVLIAAYLIGSIPFGYLIVRLKAGADIRQTGSGGTGATNVSRRAGKAAGVLTLALDALKGAGAVLIAQNILTTTAFAAQGQNSAEWWMAAAGLAAMIGHIFPVWLKFKGGKGVATGVGVFLVLAPVAVGIAALVFLLVVLLTRYVSLGSMSAALAIPVSLWVQHVFIQPVPNFPALISVALGGAFLIVFAHRQNIERLLQGRENKFS